MSKSRQKSHDCSWAPNIRSRILKRSRYFLLACFEINRHHDNDKIQHSRRVSSGRRPATGSALFCLADSGEGCASAANQLLLYRLTMSSMTRLTHALNKVLSTAALLVVLMVPTHFLADTVASRQRTVTKLAEGVYFIRHKDPPDHFLQGNSLVIIGNSGVLVVDSCYLPSSAREDIAQIRQWTNKPVRYLFNTHWRNDHTQGNAVYA